MDFDLFECEDEDIFGSIQLEPTEKIIRLSPENVGDFPEFQCSGDDTSKSQFCDGFIKNSFISSLGNFHSYKTTLHIKLSHYGFTFQEIAGAGVAQYLFGEAFLNVQHLVTRVQGGPLGSMEENTETTIYQRRQLVTKLLHLVLHCTQMEQWRFLRSHVCKLHELINRICTKDLWKSIYFANSCKGNECNVPSYHLLHGILEWKLLDICIYYKYGALAPPSNSETDYRQIDSSIFKVQLAKLFDDLLLCSLLLYAKKRSAELLCSTPFPCTCFKEVWLVLIVSLKDWTNKATIEKQHFNFWVIFNTAMVELNSKIEDYSISTLSYYEFSTWVFCSLTRLHGYRSNGAYEGSQHASFYVETLEHSDFFKKCTEQFLILNPNEEQLRTHLCLITPILLEWNHHDFLLPMLLWEYFHRRLNSSFYIPGGAPNNLAVACGSGRAYLERYRVMLEKSQSAGPDANLSSYTLFTLLLGRCLQSLLSLTSNVRNTARKLLGRIFSKFSPQKFLALNESGIHHLIELFLILALSGDLPEIMPKLRDSFLSISLDKITTQRQIAIMKGHVALLIICAEQGLDLTVYITKLLQQLKSVRNDASVAKILADGLLDIFQKSRNTFQHGESLLIDSWLPSLLQQCTPVEQERTFEAIHLIFEKLSMRTEDFVADAQNSEVIKLLFIHILPFIKQQYKTSFSEQLPQLAADFCLNIEAENFSKLFNFFVESPTANRQALAQILLKILEDGSLSRQIDAALMHVWLRSLVLLTPQHAIVKKLTTHVIELEVFRKMTNLSTEELLQAKEPLCVFIAAVGKSYDTAEDFNLRCEIADNFNAYVRNFEKWISIGSDLKLEPQTEINFRFYSFIAIVLYNCPQIAYEKSKSNCFFHVAITRFFLPTSIQIGKPPETKLTQLVHKTWHVLVQGIGRLNFKSDSYIQKTLDGLISKWTPHFKAISTNTRAVARPFIACFQAENYNLSLYICERLTSMFITTQRRQADPNACLVISIFHEIICSIISQPETTNQANQGFSKEIQRLETFMKGTCFLILEHIMMVDEIVPSQGMLLELLRRLTNSVVFRHSPALQELFVEHLKLITKKHLAYYTYFYFDLLIKIAKISFESVEKIYGFLNDEIRIVEQKRGGGDDNRIRSCLQKLRQCVDSERASKRKI